MRTSFQYEVLHTHTHTFYNSVTGFIKWHTIQTLRFKKMIKQYKVLFGLLILLISELKKKSFQVLTQNKWWVTISLTRKDTDWSFSGRKQKTHLSTGKEIIFGNWSLDPKTKHTMEPYYYLAFFFLWQKSKDYKVKVRQGRN